MAGHSQFKNIMHRKSAQDAKRAKLFTKLIREIIIAVREGQADPDFNARLRSAISTARSLNLPKDKIENAIKKGSTIGEGDNYEDIRYEGYAPGGIALIVEVLSDNRNRAASEIRSSFTKYGGSLGETGSVSFLFEHIGLIIYPAKVSTAEEMFETALDVGANSCESDELVHEICCEPEAFGLVQKELINKYGEPEVCKLAWKANSLIDVEGEQAEKLLKLVSVLEDNDDVQNVYGNYNITEEIMKKIGL
ncbi:putative transcriptional regulatory protein [Rickettsiales bacterium Ac37b]|nr:putative transcriptional regulatory protein [Rickettsiales bacterium Ac37b]